MTLSRYLAILVTVITYRTSVGGIPCLGTSRRSDNGGITVTRRRDCGLCLDGNAASGALGAIA